MVIRVNFRAKEYVYSLRRVESEVSLRLLSEVLSRQLHTKILELSDKVCTRVIYVKSGVYK